MDVSYQECKIFEVSRRSTASVAVFGSATRSKSRTGRRVSARTEEPVPSKEDGFFDEGPLKIEYGDAPIELTEDPSIPSACSVQCSRLSARWQTIRAKSLGVCSL